MPVDGLGVHLVAFPVEFSVVSGFVVHVLLFEHLDFVNDFLDVFFVVFGSGSRNHDSLRLDHLFHDGLGLKSDETRVTAHTAESSVLLEVVTVALSVFVVTFELDVSEHFSVDHVVSQEFAVFFKGVDSKSASHVVIVLSIVRDSPNSFLLVLGSSVSNQNVSDVASEFLHGLGSVVFKVLNGVREEVGRSFIDSLVTHVHHDGFSLLTGGVGKVQDLLADSNNNQVSDLLEDVLNILLRSDLLNVVPTTVFVVVGRTQHSLHDFHGVGNRFSLSSLCHVVRSASFSVFGVLIDSLNGLEVNKLGVKFFPPVHHARYFGKLFTTARFGSSRQEVFNFLSELASISTSVVLRLALGALDSRLHSAESADDFSG